jgi:hypothetical protein
MSRRYLTVEEQEQIKERAQLRCEYCQCWAEYSAQSFVYEHIVPIAKGGETQLDNLCYACGGCNGHKHTKIGGIDPLTKTVVPLYHPRTQRWHEQFGWSTDYLHVVGLTSTGRATVLALKLNRPGVINIRSLLLLARKHPPL